MSAAVSLNEVPEAILERHGDHWDARIGARRRIHLRGKTDAEAREHIEKLIARHRKNAPAKILASSDEWPFGDIERPGEVDHEKIRKAANELTPFKTLSDEDLYRQIVEKYRRMGYKPKHADAEFYIARPLARIDPSWAPIDRRGFGDRERALTLGGLMGLTRAETLRQFEEMRAAGLTFDADTHKSARASMVSAVGRAALAACIPAPLAGIIDRYRSEMRMRCVAALERSAWSIKGAARDLGTSKDTICLYAAEEIARSKTEGRTGTRAAPAGMVALVDVARRVGIPAQTIALRLGLQRRGRRGRASGGNFVDPDSVIAALAAWKPKPTTGRWRKE